MGIQILFIVLCTLTGILGEYFNDVPSIDPNGFHRGIVIDAGSGGSRLHIYTWKSRVFTSIPPSLSFPTPNEQWTQRLAPGVSSFADNPEAVSLHLEPLLRFALKVLMPYQSRWSNYPIYFKATGGMRECPLQQREEIMRHVRLFLSDKTLCPFYFQENFARVIAGEEEAVYAWAGVNFLMGTLLPSMQGMGSADPHTDTYGVLDLGGASTQISFYVPSQDISEGLFQLAIGGQKHWNLYSKSFLGFGHVSARQRHLQLLVNNVTLIVTNYSVFNSTDASIAGIAGASAADDDGVNVTRTEEQDEAVNVTAGGDMKHPEFETITNFCFFAGYAELVERDTSITTVDPGAYIQPGSKTGVLQDHVTATVHGPNQGSLTQLDQCMDSLRPLMEKNLGGYCEFIHDGQCSIDGQYQPSLPTGGHFKFIGTSSYRIAWDFLLLPPTATLSDFRRRARNVCGMSYDDVQSYAEVNDVGETTYMPYYCFMAAYNLVLLTDGYHFDWSDSLTVVGQVGGNKVGWPLGCILHEINMMPWTLDISARLLDHDMYTVAVALSVGILVGIMLQQYMQCHGLWTRIYDFCDINVKKMLIRIVVSDEVLNAAVIGDAELALSKRPENDQQPESHWQSGRSAFSRERSRSVDRQSPALVLSYSENTPLLTPAVSGGTDTGAGAGTGTPGSTELSNSRADSQVPRFTFIA